LKGNGDKKTNVRIKRKDKIQTAKRRPKKSQGRQTLGFQRADENGKGTCKKEGEKVGP